MKRFRSPLVNWSVSLMLMVGLTAHLVLPTSGKAQKTAFTQWLDRNLVDHENETGKTVRDHLRKLPAQHQEFAGFVKQVTQLVLSHRQNFKLPAQAPDQDERDLGHFWLYDTWTDHRDLGETMDGLLPDTIRSAVKGTVQPTISNPTPDHSGSRLLQPLFSGWIAERAAVISRPLPFLSGLSINAP